MKTQLAILFGWAVAALVPTTGAAQVLAPVVDVMVMHARKCTCRIADIDAEANEIVITANNALAQSGLAAERYVLAYVSGHLAA